MLDGTDKIISWKAILVEMHFGPSGKSSTSLTFVEMVSITFADATVQMNIRGLIHSAHSKKAPSWPARACKDNKRSWYIFSFYIIPSTCISASTIKHPLKILFYAVFCIVHHGFLFHREHHSIHQTAAPPPWLQEQPQDPLVATSWPL